MQLAVVNRQVPSPNHKLPFAVFTVWGSWLLEPMSSRPEVFHPTVALINSTGVTRPSLHKLDPETLKDGYKRQQIALQNLRDRIAAPAAADDDSIVLAMWLLSLLCGRLGDLDAQKIHEKSMRDFIASRNGIHNMELDSKVRRAMLQSVAMSLDLKRCCLHQTQIGTI